MDYSHVLASLAGGMITGLSTWWGFKRSQDRVEKKQDRQDDVIYKVIKEFVPIERCQQQSSTCKNQIIGQFKKGNKELENLRDSLSKISDTMDRINIEVVKINSNKN